MKIKLNDPNIDFVNELTTKTAEQTEDRLMFELNRLLKEKVISIVSTRPVLTFDKLSDQITVSRKIELSYIGEEKMKQLRDENNELKEKLQSIKDTIQDKPFPYEDEYE